VWSRDESISSNVLVLQTGKGEAMTPKEKKLKAAHAACDAAHAAREAAYANYEAAPAEANKPSKKKVKKEKP